MNTSETTKVAIITGASKGIGLAMVQKLILMGYHVYGVCRNPENCLFQHENFQLDKVDITNLTQLEAWVKSFKSFNGIELLIHNAGVGYFAPMEELNWNQIQEMISLHITAPMLITNSLLRKLKENKGRIFLIGSVAGTKVSPWGSVYGSTKAGLLHFGRELFQELRKSSVKVTNIIPDLTKTEFYEHLDFETDEDPNSYLLADCIANALENILTQRSGTVITEIVIQPEIFRIRKKKQNLPLSFAILGLIEVLR